jgi:hypothetical protein
LEADIGVMIGDSKSTIAIAQKWGIRIHPLSKRQERLPSLVDKTTIWTTESWTEIDWFLESLNADH